MNPPSGGPSLDNPQFMATILAAVQAYLEEERQDHQTHSMTDQGRWKAAGWQRTIDPALRRPRSWQEVC